MSRRMCHLHLYLHSRLHLCSNHTKSNISVHYIPSHKLTNAEYELDPISDPRKRR